MIDEIITYIGLALIGLGALSDLIASIGMHRFKNFYLRLHATTVGTIWGAVFPIIGASLIAFVYEPLGSYRYLMGGAGLVTALIIMLLAPAGSHAIARAVHRAGVARVVPCIHDELNPQLCGDRQ
ncbi:monovalent cation/H(+) antiporter subunit G [Thermosphaera chiliense]|uniref:Monovalent cation/H(+) antiporter subunit G n=1 Tax=Thermosphaera chiliense TaxID=3402707 RepID=A0A7M1UQX3_9CREN|nr:monovalent cation/H(+) antiporter subunit G [Thermosphaera aggregans]QOR93917.1 monovalent cation/H(+) antiporter subunit G [Thermosphaera aggregans]